MQFNILLLLFSFTRFHVEPDFLFGARKVELAGRHAGRVNLYQLMGRWISFFYASNVLLYDHFCDFSIPQNQSQSTSLLGVDGYSVCWALYYFSDLVIFSGDEPLQIWT